MNKQFDCIIVGGGIAGLSAALYISQADKSYVVLDKYESNACYISELTNYPGFTGSGNDLLNKLRLNINIEYAEVESITYNDGIYTVIAHEVIYESKSIIVAVGRHNRKLDIENHFEDHTHYCALCDGPLYNDKFIAVIGGGDVAVGSANYLVNTNKVTLICRKSELKSNISLNKNVNVIYNKEIKFISENGVCAYAGGTSKFDAYFICIGYDSNITNSLKLDSPGIFYCGDCINNLGQVILASADGVNKAIQCINYLNGRSWLR